jgi:hypothetical protein
MEIAVRARTLDDSPRQTSVSVPCHTGDAETVNDAVDFKKTRPA